MGGDEGQLSATMQSATMDELLDVLRLSDQRELYQRGIKQGEATDQPVDVLVSALAELPGVTGLDALRTSRRVVELLTGARWHMMRQAREEGASWTDIGRALAMTKQAAHDFYRRRIAHHAYDAGTYGAARARATRDVQVATADAELDAQVRAGQ